MNPEKLFCSILENQFNTTVDSIEQLIFLPLKGIRDVKSNISRAENIVYSITTTELTRIENVLTQVLLLDQINQLQTVENFCQIAFSCEILMDTLIENSSTYLSFLDSTTISLLRTNYQLFEKHVCVLGLRNIIGSFTNDILVELRDRLITLLNSFIDGLRLTELRDRYNSILLQSGIFDLLNNLKKFQNCAWNVCDWANTSTNKLSDYQEKLAISENNVSASGWGENIDSLLDGYYELQDEIETKIDLLVEIIDTRNLRPGIQRDEVMLN